MGTVGNIKCSLCICILQVKHSKRMTTTRGQVGHKLWFWHCEGRVTASVFRAAVHTNPCMPSQSLIKKICYPQAFKFTTESTRFVEICYSILPLLYC